MKRVASGTILMLLLTCLFASSLRFQVIEAQPSTFTVPSSYSTTLAAVDESLRGRVRSRAHSPSGVMPSVSAEGALSLAVNYPTSATYNADSIPVQLTSQGATSVFCNTLNGSSWVYAFNQTYISPTSMTGLVNGSYVFYAWASNSTSTITQTVSFTVDIEPSSSFSIFWITDTQHLSSMHPQKFNDLANWIVDNASYYNAKMIVHTGDIVDDAGATSEWNAANSAMSILLTNNVPYCWCAGNHDQLGSPDTDWIGSQYQAFNQTVMEQKPYWVSYICDGKDTAFHFVANNVDFLIIDIEYHANDTVLEWVNNLLNTYPNAYTILATHSYIDHSLNYDGQWASTLNSTVLATHSNVLMTLNGHNHGDSGAHQTVGNINELVFDRQEEESQMGAATVTILTFDTPDNQITVKTYDVNTGQFMTDPNDQFTLTTTFPSAADALSVTISPTSFTLDAGQSQLFSSIVTGGIWPYMCQWCLNGSAVQDATSSSWTFTPTSSGSYTVYLNVTDSVGVVAISNTATVNVIDPPAVSILPSSVVMDVGQSQTFNSTVSGGTLPYFYQWCLNGTAVPGATSSSWTFTPTSTGDYTIYANVTDSVGVQATSNTTTVTVNIGTHDVAVTNVALSKTVVGQGFSVNINVTVVNQGDYTETFNITACANTTSIGTQEVTALTSGNSMQLVFMWNTTGFAYGNYTLSANVQPANDNFTGGGVLVSVPGDITGPSSLPDGLVDMRDIGYVASRFLAEPGKLLWDPNADINGDGIVDMMDIGLAASHFLEHYP